MTLEKLYLRPIIEHGGAYGIAGGWARFTQVEAITRSGYRRTLPAATLAAAFPDLAEDLAAQMARITAPRAPVLDLPLDRPRLMGVCNVTPDSFSDGGAFLSAEAASARIAAMRAEGAEILDIGGESTRPGAAAVAPEEEAARIAPALAAASGARVSVDTRNAAAAMAGLRAGARLFNDVSALSHDPQSLNAARAYAEAGGAVCLMHAQGDPQTMQKDPRYDHVLLDVYAYLEGRIAVAEAAGIPRSALIVDPGIGFGKTLEHNLALLRGLSLFHGLGCALLLGVSRKRFIGTLGAEPEAARRAPGSIAAALWGVGQGAQIIRAHDIRETAQALAVWRALSSPTTQ